MECLNNVLIFIIFFSPFARSYSAILTATAIVQIGARKNTRSVANFTNYIKFHFFEFDFVRLSPSFFFSPNVYSTRVFFSSIFLATQWPRIFYSLFLLIVEFKEAPRLSIISLIVVCYSWPLSLCVTCFGGIYYYRQSAENVQPAL